MQQVQSYSNACVRVCVTVQVLSAPVKKYELPDRLTPALVEGLLASVREDAHKRGVLTSPARAQTAPPPPGGPGAGEPIRLVPHPSPTGAYGRPVPHPDVDQLVILKPHEAPPEVCVCVSPAGCIHHNHAD